MVNVSAYDWDDGKFDAERWESKKIWLLNTYDRFCSRILITFFTLTNCMQIYKHTAKWKQEIGKALTSFSTSMYTATLLIKIKLIHIII